MVSLRVLVGLVAILGVAGHKVDFDAAGDFVEFSMIQLEEHEDTETPPFSVCRFLLESSKDLVTAGDDWEAMAKKIGSVRENLPEHVRSACDDFIKHNQDDIVSLLQVGDDSLTASLEAVAEEDEAEQQASSGNTGGDGTSTSSTDDSGNAPSQQAVFAKFWEEKGQYCGACLTLTKKMQKWLSLNCTQGVVADRVMRMCGTMPPGIKAQCEASHTWVREFVIKQLLNKFPLPNHCAYIGLCEKTMVIRSLQNPLVMSESQDALLQKMEGSGDLVQESEYVLQKPHETVTTAPEVTFDLTDGGVSYRDVDRSSGEGLPKIFMDGSEDPAALLEVGNWDLSNPQDPQYTVNGQEENKVNIPLMHTDLKKNRPTTASKNYGFQQNKLPIETKYLKGCAACQFTIGALFEFMSNPRTVRAILPSVKKACSACNNAEEVQKCEDFVEYHGVAFFQDVVRQGSPAKWCPRLELCEIQYFQPSPHVLADNYEKVKDKILSVSDF